MSKRLVFKLTVMVAALSAVTLLQGCGVDEDGVDVGAAWMPVSAGTLPMLVLGTGGGAGFGGGGGGAAAGIGGAIGAAGGGNQVSAGMGVQ